MNHAADTETRVHPYKPGGDCPGPWRWRPGDGGRRPGLTSRPSTSSCRGRRPTRPRVWRQWPPSTQVPHTCMPPNSLKGSAPTLLAYVSKTAGSSPKVQQQPSAWLAAEFNLYIIYISPMCTYCNESHRVSYILYDKDTVYLYTRQHAAEPVRLFDKHKGFTCSHLNLYDHSFIGLYRDCEPNGFPA